MFKFFQKREERKENLVKERGWFASTSMLEALLESSPGIVLILNQEGKVLKVNRKFFEILGYKQREVLEKKFFELSIFAKDSKMQVKKIFDLIVNNKKAEEREIAVFSKEKKEFHFVLEEKALHDSRGNISGVAIGFSPMTVESEDSLISKLRSMSDISAGFVDIDVNSDIYKYIGESLRELIGDCLVVMNVWDAEKKVICPVGIYGMSTKDYSKILGSDPTKQEFPLTDDAYERLLNNYLTKIEGGIYEAGQGKWPLIASKTFEKITRVTAVYSMGFTWKGELYGNAMVLLQNNQKLNHELIEAFVHQASVSLQKMEADEALQKAHDELEHKVKERTRDLQKTASELEKFKLAVENSSDQITITDLDGKILYVNRAASAITGYSEEELVGKRPAIWGNDLSNQYYKKIFDKIFKDKKTYKGDVSNRKKSGEEYISGLRIDPVLDPRGDVIFYIGIERDITKEKKIDQAKTEFVSLASHQLRSPLSAINWYVELVMDNKEQLTKKQKEYLHEVYTASKRMGELVASLLNVSRIELGEFTISPKRIDIKKISENIFKELVPKIESKKHQIKKSYPKDTSYSGDEKLFRMILHNLLSNAVKYTPDNGEISLEIKRDKKWLKIKVEDNGMGIPRDQQERMFTKLFRADNVKGEVSEGTGLGMYIVKSIVDQVEGEITFSSIINKGTTFFVSLPIKGMKEKKGTKELS